MLYGNYMLIKQGGSDCATVKILLRILFAKRYCKDKQMFHPGLSNKSSCFPLYMGYQDTPAKIKVHLQQLTWALPCTLDVLPWFQMTSLILPSPWISSPSTLCSSLCSGALSVWLVILCFSYTF